MVNWVEVANRMGVEEVEPVVAVTYVVGKVADGYPDLGSFTAQIDLDPT